MVRRLLFVAVALFVLTLVVHAAPGTGEENISASSLCSGEPCDAVVRGLVSFLDRRLEGLGANGRSCADCHMPTDSFQLSPKSAEARFQLLRLRRLFNPNADDPLFRPVDADDFRINGAAANNFGTLRRQGLIRITMPLPANVKLLDAAGVPTAETFVDVWRMVPSVNEAAITGPDFQNPWPRDPNKTGGYQLDARFGSLQEQALAAFRAHAEIAVPPAAQTLDDLASFQRVLFTNNRVRALAEAMRLGTTPLPDPDPPLNALETEGKGVFNRSCAICHGGPAQTLTPSNVVRYHDILTPCPRPVDMMTPPRWVFAPCPADVQNKIRTYQITRPFGVVVRASSDPGRALLTGFVGGTPPPLDDWQKFDVSALRGIRNTAPYFHNNSAPTLEAVVDHYIALFSFILATLPPGVPLPPVISTDGINPDLALRPEHRASMLAYLRKL